MATKKITDWRGWLEGMRSKAFKAGAESLTTNIGALFTTNGLANMKVPGLEGIGMGWKTAIATCLIQFSLRVIFAAAQYVANKPDPDVITEILDTTHISRNPDTGSVEVGMSTTVKTTPLSPVATDAANPPKP